MILGAFRSGTSSLAAVFGRLGLYFGEEQALYGANEFNPGGHFELKDMQALHAGILDAFSMQFYSGAPLPENWEEWPPSPYMVAGIRGMLHKHFSGRSKWAFKDPAGSELVPLYKAALAQDNISPRFAICVRHPFSVMSSMRKRSGAPDKSSAASGPYAHSRNDLRTMGAWVYFTLAALKETENDRRQLFSYEDVLENPPEYVRRATQLLDQPVGEEKIKAAVASIDPKLSHTRFSLDELDEWPSIIKRLYELCLRADKDQDGFVNGRYNKEIDALWDEWKRDTASYRPVQMPGFVSYSGPTFEYKIQNPPHGEWTSIDVRKVVTGVLFPTLPSPSLVWIRRAIWDVDGTRIPADLSARRTNGTIEDVYGVKALTVYGHNPVRLETPVGENVTLHLECMLDCELNAQLGAVRVLREELDSYGRRR